MAVVEDIGSFPLPNGITKKDFDTHYKSAQEHIASGSKESLESFNIIKDTVIESFKRKASSGLDIVTYPQHYDMHNQFLEPIIEYQKEPFLIENNKAQLLEVEIIKSEGGILPNENPIELSACVTGPIELYLRTEFGNNIYKDVLENLARSVNYFLKNSIIKTPHVKTVSLSLDEPSLGFADLLNINRDDIIDILERTLKGVSVPVRIHLHTLKASEIALETDGIHTIGGEFAGTPENINFIHKKDLESHDKFLRAGVTRTNIDSIIAEHMDRGIEPTPMQLIEEKNLIKSRIRKIDSIFGETVSVWGPDCGLGSWPNQDVASELLSRTAMAVRESFK